MDDPRTAAIAAAIASGKFPWWFPAGGKGKQVDFFTYATDFNPLALSATAQNNINIGGDAAFIILSQTLVETATDNVTFLSLNPLLCRLTDGGSGRYLSNTPVHVNNWFGTAQLPKYLDVPKLLNPNTTFGVELQNLEATARNVRVAFHGLKIFAYKP